MVYPWAVVIGIGVGIAGLFFMLFQEQRQNGQHYGYGGNNRHTEDPASARNSWDPPDDIGSRPSHRKRRLSNRSSKPEIVCCTICQDPIGNEYNATVLPCLDKFHTLCIQPWIKENSTCPNCRESIYQ